MIRLKSTSRSTKIVVGFVIIQIVLGGGAEIFRKMKGQNYCARKIGREKLKMQQNEKESLP